MEITSNNIANSLVFIPGWGFTKEVWSQFKKLLSDKYQIIDLSYPVYSPDIRDIEKILCIIVEEYEKQIPDNSILIGWSLGGLIASYLSYKFPSKVNKLITISSSPKFAATETWAGINGRELNNFRSLAYSNMENLLKRFSMLTCSNKDRKLILETRKFLKNPNDDKQELLLYLDILIDADIRNIYSKISVPTLHIFGDSDVILPKETAKGITSLNKNHKTELIKNSGHIPFWTDKDLVINKINSFIEE